VRKNNSGQAATAGKQGEAMREKILAIIEKNSKLTTKDIAAILGEPEESVRAEVEAMENEHIICGYHTLINWDKTDDERVDALIEVKVTPQRGMGFDSIAERIYQYDEVDAVYLMSGAFDFTVLIKGKTMKEVANFVSLKLSPMDSVLSTATHFVLKKYKDHGTIIERPRKDERMKVSP
jgi:DNA-binding Lrp family transcriptional regulator